MSLREGRRRLFEAAGLDDRAYDRRWLSFDLGPLSIHYPMTAGMRFALPRHDLHHVLTGYGTDVIGETEIAAWELGSGCGRLWTAWYGNLAFMSLGLMLSPIRTYTAFLRGRASSNLYAARAPLEALLGRSIGELRAALGLDRRCSRPRLGDRAVAAAVTLVAVPAGLSFLVATGVLFLVYVRRPEAEGDRDAVSRFEHAVAGRARRR